MTRWFVFPDGLFTDLADGPRSLRLGLTMPDREFLNFNEFQSLYREFPEEVRTVYMSNPAHLETSRQGHIAFTHKANTPIGIAEPWTLEVRDPKVPHKYEITELGEWEFMDDGTVRRVPA